MAQRVLFEGSAAALSPEPNYSCSPAKLAM
jgi:hypothetical protein